MFDLGWTELLVIGIVALIVVGPKDLPGMFRAVGNFVGKAKRMARDFSQAMNDAADEAGVSEVKKSFDAASNPMKSAMNEVKKSTESFTEQTMAGPRKAADPERDKQAERIRQRAAELAGERQAREAETPAAHASGAPDASPKPEKPATGKSTSKGKAGSGASTARASKSATAAKPRATARSGTKTGSSGKSTAKSGNSGKAGGKSTGAKTAAAKPARRKSPADSKAGGDA